MKIFDMLVETVRVVHGLAGKVAQHDRDLAQQMRRAMKQVDAVIALLWTLTYRR